MKEQTIKLDEGTKNHIESLHYDIQTMQGLLAFMMDQNLNINSETGLKYQAELTQKKKLYEAAKTEITSKFIPNELQTAEYYWDLDFKNSCLVVKSRLQHCESVSCKNPQT